MTFARDVADAEVAAALAHWHTHGWARLPRVASEQTLSTLRDHADAIVAGTSGLDGLFFQPDSSTGRYDDLVFGHGYTGPDTAYRKIEKLERDPAFRAWLGNPLFARIVQQVYGPSVSLYRATLFWKSARVGSDLPYHQDGGRFWGLTHDPQIQLWTALDDATVESGCLVVLPGTHLAGLATPLGGVVPAELVARAEPEVHEVAVPADAGDVLLIHNYLWHRSGANRSDRPRRAFTTAYLHGATRCRRQKRAPRLFMQVWGGGTDP